MEGVFAERAFAPGVIDADQAGDHGKGRRGLQERDRLLVDDARGLRMNGDVRETALFNATFIADAQVDAACPTEIRGQTADENVVV
jgi:hypothetical protein